MSSDAAASKPTPAQMIESMLALLGDRDPLEVMKCTGAALGAACAGLNDTALRTPEAPGKWSVIEVVKHLGDAELVFAVRFRCVLAEPNSAMSAINADAWSTRLRYVEADLAAALAQFNAVREINLRFLQGLSEAEWNASYTHSIRGKETLRQSARLYAAHDLRHLAQIERIKQRVTSSCA